MGCKKKELVKNVVAEKYILAGSLSLYYTCIAIPFFQMLKIHQKRVIHIAIAISCPFELIRKYLFMTLNSKSCQ